MYDCSLYRQEALLAAISEKDANIALLELSSSKKKKTQDEVASLKREKDGLVHQLKQQVGLCAQTYAITLTPKWTPGTVFGQLFNRRGAEMERKCREGEKGSTGEVAMTRGSKENKRGREKPSPDVTTVL